MTPTCYWGAEPRAPADGDWWFPVDGRHLRRADGQWVEEPGDWGCEKTPFGTKAV